MSYRRDGRGRSGVAVISGSAGRGLEGCAERSNRRGALGSGRCGRCAVPHYRAEKDFDLDLLQIAILKLHDLVESLLTNRRFGLLKGLVLALDDCPAH